MQAAWEGRGGGSQLWAPVDNSIPPVSSSASVLLMRPVGCSSSPPPPGSSTQVGLSLRVLLLLFAANRNFLCAVALPVFWVKLSHQSHLPGFLGLCCLSRCHHVLPPLCSPMALQGGNPQPSPRVAPALEKPGLATFSRESDLALTAGLWGQTGLSVNWIQCTCDLGQNSLASLSPGACIE